MLKYKFNKGQVGETMSWIIVTIIIVGILIISVYISSLMSKVKNINIGDLKFDSDEDFDLLQQKAFFAYQLSLDKNKEAIENILNETS